MSEEMTRKEALEELDSLLIPRDGEQDKLADAFEMAIKALEQEPETGHWIKIPKYGKWICSECGTKFRFTFKEHDYCPNCGEKMEEQA